MKKLFLVLSVPVFLYSCGSDNNSAQNGDKKEDLIHQRNTDIDKVVIEKIGEGPEFPNAALTIKDVHSKGIDGSDSVEVTFNFDVKNYELKAQTPDASSRSCNNSKDGQHIHFIMDNQPYTALYEPVHTVKMKKDSEHTLLVFLSRSYHLSLKNETAYEVMKFKVDDKGQIKKLDTGKEPMLFYSRPKGTYLGADVENVLLDFYLVNAQDSLKSGGYTVLANVGGKEFSINEWTPYFIKNLPLGKHTITLALIDKDRELIGGNKVQIDITLADKEPIK